jgi:hypothetical protein
MFQKEFNPLGLSNTGFPYLGDKLTAVFPEMITPEVREIIEKVKQAKWRGL